MIALETDIGLQPQTATSFNLVHKIRKHPILMKYNNQFASLAFACLTAIPTQIRAATIITGDVTSNLGPDFFFDSAAGGGGDFQVNQPNLANFDRSFGTLNVGAGGSDITVSGIGWATLNSGTANDATSATVTITYLGVDGAFGGGDDMLIGSVTNNFTFAANGEYYWKFDTSLNATIDGLNNLFRVSIEPINGASNGSLSFKTSLANPNGNASNAKISVAGTSVAVVPEPSAALLGCVGLLALLRRLRA